MTKYVQLGISFLRGTEKADTGDIVYHSIVVVIFIILMSSFLAVPKRIIGKINKLHEIFADFSFKSCF